MSTPPVATVCIQVSKLRVYLYVCTTGHPHHPPTRHQHFTCVHMYISHRSASTCKTIRAPDADLIVCGGWYVGAGTLGYVCACGIVAAGGRDREGREGRGEREGGYDMHG